MGSFYYCISKYINKYIIIYRVSFKIIPIYVGSMDYKMNKSYGEIFKKYLEDKNSFFIISSYLTHWGAK